MRCEAVAHLKQSARLLAKCSMRKPCTPPPQSTKAIGRMTLGWLRACRITPSVSSACWYTSSFWMGSFRATGSSPKLTEPQPPADRPLHSMASYTDCTPQQRSKREKERGRDLTPFEHVQMCMQGGSSVGKASQYLPLCSFLQLYAQGSTFKACTASLAVD